MDNFPPVLTIKEGSQLLQPEQKIERAGKAIAALIQQLLEDDLLNRSIVILAGRGFNGGAALAAARALLEAGAWVQILCVFPVEATKIEGESEVETGTAAQLILLQTQGAPLAWAEEGWELPACDLLVDAMGNKNVLADPQGREREMILLANSSAAPILSVDCPSGINADQGQCFSPHIRASATIFLETSNPGLRQQPGRSACGTLYFADIN